MESKSKLSSKAGPFSKFTILQSADFPDVVNKPLLSKESQRKPRKERKGQHIRPFIYSRTQIVPRLGFVTHQQTWRALFWRENMIIRVVCPCLGDITAAALAAVFHQGGGKEEVRRTRRYLREAYFCNYFALLQKCLKASSGFLFLSKEDESNSFHQAKLMFLLQMVAGWISSHFLVVWSLKQ